MKLKPVTMIINKLIFIAGIIGFITILFNVRLSAKMETILSIFLIIGSMSEFIETRKFRKLIYPLIIIYFLILLPIIENFIYNRFLYIGVVVLSIISALMILCNEVINTIKEKNTRLNNK
ncbi:hypothetical protein [Clostridium sp. BL-8]|uniref:hypothetical protein n=1 Tax=Clostridium sp. BL-8 TaxID=349938 RepID=UPI00098BEC68|nr:hypothetical protein [Clostridium sp. BL-8]OOM72352.1 hypothetical protein CLOBL_48500 [Clostridium sp. BL-8]